MQCTLVPWNLSYSPDHHHHHLLGQQRPPGLAKGVLINDQTQELSPPRLPAAAGRSCDYRGPGARVTIPGSGPMTDGVAGKYKTKYQVYTVVGEQQQYASKCNASLLPLIVLARLLSSSLPGSWPWHLFHLCVCLPRKWSSLSHQIVTTLSATAPLLSRHSVLPNIYCTVWNKVIWISPFIFPVYIGSEDELVCP